VTIVIIINRSNIGVSAIVVIAIVVVIILIAVIIVLSPLPSFYWVAFFTLYMHI